MDIREITDKKIWEDFLLGVSEKTFLNSWNWGEFNKAMKNKIWRLGVFNNKRLIALGLVSKIKAKRGTFLLLQHAPCIIANGEQFLKYDIVKSFLEELKKIAKEEKAIFIRMNPLWNRDVENIDTVRKLGFTEAPIHANAYESTWKLDISLPEDELLRQMRKTTRYLIRLASKNQDIIVEKSEKPNDISIYQELNKKVAQRQRFVPFSSDYIKNEFDIFSEPVSSVNRNSFSCLGYFLVGRSILSSGSFNVEIRKTFYSVSGNVGGDKRSKKERLYIIRLLGVC